MKYPFLVIAALGILSCKNKTPSSTSSSDQGRDSASASKEYFPVMDFLKSEIAYVDSLPVGIMKYRSAGSKKDSGYIQLDEFHKLAVEFLPQEIHDSVFSRNFKETSFIDNSTNTANFYYSSLKDSLPVKRIDVVSAPGQVNDKIKSVYLEKEYQAGDTSKLKKLYWKPGRNFQIITQTAKGSDQPVTELIKVVWDNRE